MGLLGYGGDLTAAGGRCKEARPKRFSGRQTLTRDKDQEFRLDTGKSSFCKGWCSPGTGHRGAVDLLPWEASS